MDKLEYLQLEVFNLRSQMVLIENEKHDLLKKVDKENMMNR